MSNITEELKKKFGGKGQTIAEVVKTMESGGGSGGGGGMFLVTIDENATSGHTVDKTLGEVKAAIADGLFLMGFYIAYGSTSADGYYIPMKQFTPGAGTIDFGSYRYTAATDDDYFEPYE